MCRRQQFEVRATTVNPHRNVEGRDGGGNRQRGDRESETVLLAPLDLVQPDKGQNAAQSGLPYMPIRLSTKAAMARALVWTNGTARAATWLLLMSVHPFPLLAATRRVAAVEEMLQNSPWR